MNALAKKTVAAYLAAVFAAGLFAGGFAGFSLGKKKAFTPPRRQDMAVHICERLKSKLHLTAEQVEKIEPLVNEAATELQSVQSAAAERITEIFQKLNRRQTQYLTSEQKVLLGAMERERQQFFRRDPNGQPASPPDSPPTATELNPSAAPSGRNLYRTPSDNPKAP